MTIKDIQEWEKNFAKSKGINFTPDEATKIGMFKLIEEIGEVAKAIRNHTNLHTQKTQNKEKTKAELASELADVLNYLLDISNHFEIDLAQAFRDKNTENEGREWN